MKFLYIAFTIVTLIACTKQNSKIAVPQSDEDRIQNMLLDAQVYTHSLETLDKKTMVEYTLPAYLRMNGGKDVYLRSMEELSQPKGEIESTKIDIISTGIMIKGDGNKYYSVLEQKTEQKLTGIAAPVNSNIKIVAESQDGGLNWKFAFMLKAEILKYYSMETALEINKHLDH